MLDLQFTDAVIIPFALAAWETVRWGWRRKVEKKDNAVERAHLSAKAKFDKERNDRLQKFEEDMVTLKTEANKEFRALDNKFMTVSKELSLYEKTMEGRVTALEATTKTLEEMLKDALKRLQSQADKNQNTLEDIKDDVRELKSMEKARKEINNAGKP